MDKKEMTKEEQAVKSRIAAKEARELLQVIAGESEPRSSEYAYPDYYGGIYLDDKYDLVLVIVDDNPEKFRSMAEEKVKSVKLHLQKGDFSMNELKKNQEILDDFLRDSAQENIRDNFILAGLDEKANRIFVELKDCSPEKINEFKEAFMDSPVILFK